MGYFAFGVKDDSLRYNLYDYNLKTCGKTLQVRSHPDRRVTLLKRIYARQFHVAQLSFYKNV